MKTNKTKPIKKIMIFTIITVMIVSLFAVPAFADEPQVTNLIGTTWRFEPDNLYGITAGYGNFYIDGRLSFYNGEELVNRPTVFGGIAPGYYDSSVVPFDDLVETSDAIAFGAPYEDALLYLSVTAGPYPNQYILLSFDGGSDISNPLFIDFINTYGTLVSSEADGEEQGIFAVWSKITQWIVQGLASVSNAFYSDGKLTLLGTLCIIPLALGLACLLIGIIQKFLRLRG